MPAGLDWPPAGWPVALATLEMLGLAGPAMCLPLFLH